MSATADEFHDLCWTCNHSTECLQKATLLRPVWFCEEFDCYVRVQKMAEKDKAPQETVSCTIEEEADRYEGLCRNCEDRQICAYSRTGERTLYCEEYR